MIKFQLIYFGRNFLADFVNNKTNILKFLVKTFVVPVPSVAESEPPEAATFRVVEPEPIFFVGGSGCIFLQAKNESLVVVTKHDLKAMYV